MQKMTNLVALNVKSMRMSIVEAGKCEREACAASDKSAVRFWSDQARMQWVDALITLLGGSTEELIPKG